MMIMMMVIMMVTMMVNICEYDCDLVMKVILVKEVMSCDVSPVAMFLVGILSFYTQKFLHTKVSSILSHQIYSTPSSCICILCICVFCICVLVMM